jgi:hypothetical protein
MTKRKISGVRDLYERRMASREREEILVETASERWEDLQDWLDRTLIVPGDTFETVSEWKERNSGPPAVQSIE